jgi:prepilin-type N-terminal cleavage/methylation domain-containing protein
MKTIRGFTLVEVIVALGMFAIISAAISGLMISNLRTRQGSQQSLNAQQIAYAVIEHHRQHWSVLNNYDSSVTGAQVLPAFSTASYTQNVGINVSSIDISYGCLDANGTNRTDTASLSSLRCSLTNPALRSITVVVKDSQNNQTARLVAEIGRPSAKRSGLTTGSN